MRIRLFFRTPMPHEKSQVLQKNVRLAGAVFAAQAWELGFRARGRQVRATIRVCLFFEKS